MTSKTPPPEGRKHTPYTSSSKSISRRGDETISSKGPRLPRISFWSSPIKWTRAYFSERTNKKRSIHYISQLISDKIVVSQEAKIKTGTTEAQYKEVLASIIKSKLGKYPQEQLQGLQDLLKDENAFDMVLSSQKPQETIILLLENLDTARSLFKDLPAFKNENPNLSPEKINQFILEGLEKKDPSWIKKLISGKEIPEDVSPASRSFIATKGATIDRNIFEDVEKHIRAQSEFSSFTPIETEVKLDKSLSAYKMTYLVMSDTEGLHLQIKLDAEGKKPLISKVVSFRPNSNESFSELIERTTSSDVLIPALNEIKQDLIMKYRETTQT